MGNALDRIKALNKLDGEDHIIKGNKISRGTSLSGEAKEKMQVTYFDGVHARLKANWALPIWLSRQNHRAKVKIFIDGLGHIKGIRFMVSSGSAEFNSEVRRAIEQSVPFSPPPKELITTVLVEGILLGFPL